MFPTSHYQPWGECGACLCCHYGKVSKCDSGRMWVYLSAAILSTLHYVCVRHIVRSSRGVCRLQLCVI